MSETDVWEKFIGGGKCALVVEVRDRKVTIGVDTFRDIMEQAGWRRMEKIIIGDTDA